MWERPPLKNSCKALEQYVSPVFPTSSYVTVQINISVSLDLACMCTVIGQTLQAAKIC